MFNYNSIGDIAELETMICDDTDHARGLSRPMVNCL